MRYHQGRLIRQNELFVRNCKICGTVILLLVGALAIGG